MSGWRGPEDREYIWEKLGSEGLQTWGFGELAWDWEHSTEAGPKLWSLSTLGTPEPTEAHKEGTPKTFIYPALWEVMRPFQGAVEAEAAR